jgi:LmbE family N-acetylglucosaminyl deacetylase
MTAGYIVRDAAVDLKMKKMPVFLYIRDFYTCNFSYIPDLAVSIDSVWETKLAACAAQKSQVTEAIPHQLGILEEVRNDKEKQRQLIYDNTYPFSKVTPDNLYALQKWYGAKAAATVKYAESFEIAEFGRQVNEEELKRLVPMIDNPHTVSNDISGKP